MLRLQSHLICALRAASHAPALHWIRLSTAAASATAAATPAQFAVEDYLVASCGLTAAQALRASKHLRHLKSPANPDAVRAFLAGAGLAESHVAAAIAMDSRILCSSVDNTLTPRVAQLLDMGLSPPQISRLLSIRPRILHSSSRIARLEFYISLFGSYDKVEAALKRNFYLLEYDIQSVVRPNLAFLQQCGLSDCDIAKLFRCTGKLPTNNLEHLKKMVARAEELGVRRSTGMFTTALIAICNFTPERISAKMESMERALGYPEAKIAVSKLPSILNLSEITLANRVEFLRIEFGLEPSYIAHRPAILMYSLEMRLIPRHYVIQILKAKGLVKRDIDLFGVFCSTHQKFVEKYLNCR
jgi:mTERF domain-containing protein